MKHKSKKYKLKYWFSSIDTWKPKKNDKVFVCYDGKYSRRRVGVITKFRGSSMSVTFRNYDGELETLTAHRKRGGMYSGWLVSDDTIMDKLFDCVGDYYSVCKYNAEDDLTIVKE